MVMSPKDIVAAALETARKRREATNERRGSSCVKPAKIIGWRQKPKESKHGGEGLVRVCI